MKTKVNFYNPLIYFHDEIWKNIKKSIYGLKVSNMGQIILIRDNKEQLLQQYNTCGYLMIFPSVNGKCKGFYVHRLVAEAFIENPKNLKQVNHIDGMKYNNYFENLEWCSASQNMKHAFRTGLNFNPIGQNHNAAKLNDDQVREIKEDLSNGIKPKEIALKFGVTKMMIYYIKNEQFWRHIKKITFRNLNEFF